MIVSLCNIKSLLAIFWMYGSLTGLFLPWYYSLDICRCVAFVSHYTLLCLCWASLVFADCKKNMLCIVKYLDNIIPFGCLANSPKLLYGKNTPNKPTSSHF